MKINKILMSIVFLFFMSSFASAWTPPSDADFRYYYDLNNVSVASFKNVSGNIANFTTIC